MPQDPEPLPGWQGEISQKKPSTIDTRTASTPPPQGQPWIEQLSWHPRAYVYHNFLSYEECDHIIGVAEPFIKRSTVVDAKTGGSVLDEIRTSYGMFIPRQYDDVIKTIEHRIANWTMFPMVNGEDIQVLRYQNGQKYGDHFDYFDASIPGAMENGNRVATVLMYLSNVEFGGETCFHAGTPLNPDQPMDPSFSECADRGVCIRPERGAALLFYDMMIDGIQTDPASLHTGCPTLEGTKWSATKWIHNKPFRPENIRKVDYSKCENRNQQCDDWAKSGECEKNEGFMVGTLIDPGMCRLACGACKACAEGDVLCQRGNYAQAVQASRKLNPGGE